MTISNGPDEGSGQAGQWATGPAAFRWRQWMSVNDRGQRLMKMPCTPEASARPTDLDSTRRRFLFAREQLAAQRSSERYFAVRDMRRWAIQRPFPQTADGAAR
jgi:hypothetical protein